MEIENIKIELVTTEDKDYSLDSICACCGGAISPVKQGNKIDYYYLVNDRAICSTHLGEWLGKLGTHIADNPRPYWLHHAINSK